MRSQVIAYVPDAGDAVCPDCATDVEKEEVIATVILRVDEWAEEAVRDGIQCARCKKTWRGDIEEGDWE